MDEFDNIYEKIAEENEVELEKLREEAKKENQHNKKIRKRFIYVGLIIGILLTIVVIILTKSNLATMIISIIGLYFLVAFYVVLAIILCGAFFEKNKKSEEYTYIFKTKIIQALLDTFGTNLRFDPKSGIISSEYDEAEFEGYYNLFDSEDLIKGTLKNNCEFQMSELLVERESTDSDGNSTYHTLFEGLFAKVKMERAFNRRIVSSKRQERYKAFI